MEERGYDNSSNSTIPSTTLDSESKYGKYSLGASGARGTGTFDRDEKVSELDKKSAGLTDKRYDPKIPSINGNIIHVTVNNYLTPSNPVVSGTNPTNNALQKSDLNSSNIILNYLTKY